MGRLELDLEPATESIEAVFGVLAGRSERKATLEDIHEASHGNSSSGSGAASAAGCPRP